MIASFLPRESRGVFKAFESAKQDTLLDVESQVYTTRSTRRDIMSNNTDKIIDIKAAAKYLRIKERTLYSLIKSKKVPGVKIGGQWRFKKSQLDAN